MRFETHNFVGNLADASYPFNCPFTVISNADLFGCQSIDIIITGTLLLLKNKLFVLQSRSLALSLADNQNPLSKGWQFEGIVLFWGAISVQRAWLTRMHVQTLGGELDAWVSVQHLLI